MENLVCRLCIFDRKDGLARGVGSAFLVKSNSDIFLVTANHVLSDYPLSEGQSYYLYFSPLPLSSSPVWLDIKEIEFITPSNKVVQYDYDLCFSRICSYNDLKQLGLEDRATNIERFSQIAPSDTVLIVGFPAFNDNDDDEHQIPYLLKSTVVAYSGDFIALENVDIDRFYGGLSGAPAFTMDRLVGVLKAQGTNVLEENLLLLIPSWQITYLIGHVFPKWEIKRNAKT